MGKILDRYMSEYEEAMAPIRAEGNLVLKSEVWITAKWQQDNQLFPGELEFNVRMLEMEQEDLEMAAILWSGTLLLLEQARVRNLIRKVAEREGVSVADFQKRVQERIDAAWESLDPPIRKNLLQHFPDGKPTPEEFLGRALEAF